VWVPFFFVKLFFLLEYNIYICINNLKQTVMKTLQLTEEELHILWLCVDVSSDHYGEQSEEEWETFKTLKEKVDLLSDFQNED